ncbi:MAG TPA: M48 family metallopeptidase [Candidatus Paceibacterota bacterium]|nr:M48 family metallopeptidase [Candidatus Paceibacterota bacterium]
MQWMRRNRRQYLTNRENARRLVHERIRHFNQVYGFSVGKIFIKNHKSRWGSCSEKGNLNFNYKIAFLPAELVDYIVVHELCHLKEFNHSPQFWSLVGETIPDHRRRRSALRTLERSRASAILSS